ncbi:MAG: hypothetical protein IKJ74_06480 [Clostridia bacterium]|nr:hypothetical protein [Clostridia bacterium]
MKDEKRKGAKETGGGGRARFTTAADPYPRFFGGTLHTQFRLEREDRGGEDRCLSGDPAEHI